MLNNSEKVFLQLLRAGLWQEPLSLDDKAIDWDVILLIANRQTVLGIVFDGICQLPKELQPPKEMILKWYAVLVQIEQTNQNINAIVEEVVGKYKQRGLNPILLKGQGIAKQYTNPLHRQSGDIDLYLGDDYEKANAIYKEWNCRTEEETSFHQAFWYKGFEIENHKIYVDFYSNQNKKRLNQWFERQKTYPKQVLTFGNESVETLSLQTNLTYIFLHMLHHLLQVGVGLRQLCDWASLIEHNKSHIDKEAWAKDIKILPIETAIKAFAYVASHYLGCDETAFPFSLKDKKVIKDGEFLLADILKMGNFGHDTATMKNFGSKSKVKRIYSYLRGLKRQIIISRFCPREVMAYPFNWLKRKLMRCFSLRE